MKRNAGAQAGEGKLESRFAALTSGLLARKGQAAPSNSPIHDPAEETDAFALEPTRKADKKRAPAEAPKTVAPKPAPLKAAAPEAKAPAKEAPVAKKPVAAETAAQKKPAPAAEIRLQPADRIPAPGPTPMTVINERSSEAGYPDNPSPEEIAALDAEADEVVSYFENFGSEDAVALEKDDFYGDDDGDILDELDDVEDDAGAPSRQTADNAIAGPWAGASVPAVAANAAAEVRAGVTVQLTAREFMRLSLGAAELDQSAQDMIVEAIEEYLDARGVLSLGGCSCLDALTKKPG